MTYRSRRQGKRDAQREALVARMVAPITAEVRGPDPLEHGRSAVLTRVTSVIGLTSAATVAHVAVLGCFFLVGIVAEGAEATTRDEKLRVTIVESAPEVETIVPVQRALPVKAPEPEPEITPEPDPVKAPPKPKRSRRKAKRTPKEAPPEPIEALKKPEAPSDTPRPRRRIVGLSLESTTTGGSGPSFAVGTTRMGQTASTASDPRLASRHPAAKGSATTPQPPQPSNTVAAHVPTAGVTFEKPKRVGKITPAYPDLLRAQGVEADVVVAVTIDASGDVTKVSIVTGSHHPEFDKAAQAAARKERFEPATRNGRPITRTIQYTYRFRLSH